MTLEETARLAVVEARQEDMQKSLAEIKVLLTDMNGHMSELTSRGNDRHEKLESRLIETTQRENERYSELAAKLAVQEDRSSRLEKLLWATGGVGGGAAVGHIPAVITLLNGAG